jgi:hypothetical protein
LELIVIRLKRVTDNKKEIKALRAKEKAGKKLNNDEDEDDVGGGAAQKIFEDDDEDIIF